MDKQNSNDNKRRISVDEDYIELLNSVNIDDEYEDIYSDSSMEDIYSDSSSDIYIGRKNIEKDVYIAKSRPQFYTDYDYEESDDSEPTQQIPKVSVNNSRNEVVYDDEDEDDVSDFEVRHGGGKKKKKNPFLIFLIVLLVIVVGFAGVAFVAVKGVISSVSDNFVKGDEIEHIEDVSSLASADHVKNILLIGCDEEKGGSSRSDSIMIASVNSKTGKVTIVSILRDTHVDVPGHRESKINAAHSWGGPNLLIQTIEQNFGVKIDDYATVNFEMFESLVDGIGGIYVDVSEGEAEHMNSYFKLGQNGKPAKVESGENVYLNGYQALCYARIRKLDSDFYRTQRQRKVIASIAENVKGRLTPEGVGDLMEVAKDVAPYIETTLSDEEIISLLGSLSSCFVKSEGKTENLLVSAQLPFDDTWYYSDEWDGSSISIDLEENRELLYELLYSENTEAELEETTEE